MSGFGEGQTRTRADVLDSVRRHLSPHRTETFRRFGVEIVMAERAGYRFRNLGGDMLYDLHLNGGTYNLGHLNPELVEALTLGVREVDVGNHHFASPSRAELAEALLATQNFGARYVVLGTTGSEAVDVAIKAARKTTGRRAVVGIDRGYHGRSGFSGATGDASAARFFLSDDPVLFRVAPFNDAEAVERLLAAGDVACVIIEPSPATHGFPQPADGYLAAIRRACDNAGALLVADEVQTGLGRTGSWWAIERFGVKPDMIVTTKGLGGGLYPVAATLMTERAGAWLEENGWAHVSTFGGAELGCRVARRVLDITSRPETWRSVHSVAARLGEGLREIMCRNPYLVEIRQTGLVIGLKLDHPEGALHAMKGLFDRGVWAIFAGFDMSLLQFKPGLLLTMGECEDILDRVEQGLLLARDRRGEAPLGVAA